MLGPTSSSFRQSFISGLPCATKQGCRATQLSPRIKVDTTLTCPHKRLKLLLIASARSNVLSLCIYAELCWCAQCCAQITLRKASLCTASLDPWKTLGVAHDADDVDIKKAYRKLVLQWASRAVSGCTVPQVGKEHMARWDTLEITGCEKFAIRCHSNWGAHSWLLEMYASIMCCPWSIIVPDMSFPDSQAPPWSEGLPGRDALCQDPRGLWGGHRQAAWQYCRRNQAGRQDRHLGLPRLVCAPDAPIHNLDPGCHGECHVHAMCMPCACCVCSAP